MSRNGDGHWRRTLIVCLGLTCAAACEAADEDVLEITGNTQLDPARTYGRVVIRASNITVDGGGAWLVGSREGDPKEFRGTAISAEGVSNVTLRNVKARGWETGLHVVRGEGWTIEDCDFSDNFHDPRFGWGENGRRGGIVLEQVHRSLLRKNRANRVWDGCVLVDSHENELAENDFSHTSNTCLKFWTACRNTVTGNRLSHGIRIDPGEVHARDSTCVLIESGSHDNRFVRNDCTHGGDGIFVRVLNGWVSTGNVFEENDCSYANNNCVEAWSPRNTWIRNKSNHGSYGFWLGASDQNVLLENEASYNGLPDGHHNSPHLPEQGHAGIVFMFGPSSHTVVRGNTCRGNHGAGIAAIGDLGSAGKKWNAFHWLVEQNTLAENRWGIYLQHADMFDLAANRFEKNSKGNVFQAGNVTGLVRREAGDDIRQPPKAVLQGPSVVTAGESVAFDASGSTDPRGRSLTYRWQIGSDVLPAEAKVTRTFDTPGFHRLALTVNNGQLSDLAWRDLYVVDAAPELADAERPESWSWEDPGSKVEFALDRATRLVGEASLRANANPYGGGRVTLTLKLTAPQGNLQGKRELVFWLKTRNEHVPGWQDVNPVVGLRGADGRSLLLTPEKDLLSQPPYIEAREGWLRLAVPLFEGDGWQRTGELPETATQLTMGFDSWGAPPLTFWLDGIHFR